MKIANYLSNIPILSRQRTMVLLSFQSCTCIKKCIILTYFCIIKQSFIASSNFIGGDSNKNRRPNYSYSDRRTHLAISWFAYPCEIPNQLLLLFTCLDSRKNGHSYKLHPTTYDLVSMCCLETLQKFETIIYGIGPIFMGLKSRIFRQDTLKMDPQMNQEPMISQFWKRRRHYHHL